MPTSPSSRDSFVHLHVHTEYSMLDGAAQDRRPVRRGRPDGDAGRRDHRPRLPVRRLRVLEEGEEVRRQADHRLEAYLTPGTSRFDRTRVRWGDGRRGRRVRRRRLHPHDAAGPENNEGMHNLFRMGSLASLEGHFYKPRMDRELLHDVRQGAHRDDRLPVRRGADPAAARAVRGGASRRPPSSGTSSARRTTTASSWTTGSTSSAGSRRTCCGSPRTSTCRWSRRNDLHYTQAEDAKAHAVLLCVQSGSTLADPKRFKFDADDFYLKSAAGDARPVARAARGLRQHAA